MKPPFLSRARLASSKLPNCQTAQFKYHHHINLVTKINKKNRLYRAVGVADRRPVAVVDDLDHVRDDADVGEEVANVALHHRQRQARDEDALTARRRRRSASLHADAAAILLRIHRAVDQEAVVVVRYDQSTGGRRRGQTDAGGRSDGGAQPVQIPGARLQLGERQQGGLDLPSADNDAVLEAVDGIASVRLAGQLDVAHAGDGAAVVALLQDASDADAGAQRVLNGSGRADGREVAQRQARARQALGVDSDARRERVDRLVESGIVHVVYLDGIAAYYACFVCYKKNCQIVIKCCPLETLRRIQSRSDPNLIN